MTTTRASGLAAAGVLALLLAAGPPARARVSEGVVQLELYVSRYDPRPAAIDDDAAFGARFGFNATQRINLQGTVGRFDSAAAPAGSAEIRFVEITVGYHLLANHRFVPVLGGGVGGAEDRDRESWTVHAAVGFKLDLSRRTYLRADQRYRWFEDRDDAETDRELSFGVGIRFGN